MASKKVRVQSITIIGRRWRDVRAGNTYCSAVMLVNGRPVGTFGQTYGYGDHYESVAFGWLETNGYVFGRERYSNGFSEGPWHWCKRNGVAYYATAADVKNKRDLFE